MTDTQAVEPIVDADIVEENPPQEMKEQPQSGAPDVLMELESMIKSHIASLETRRNDLKKIKEMVNDILRNDPVYREHDEEVKKATKAKKEIQSRLMRQPEAMKVAEKMKNLSAETKELDMALSDYLREYQRLTGANQIETDDGQVLEIVYVAKLLKKK